MAETDKESQEFINWALTHLGNEDVFREFKKEALENLLAFFNSSDAKLLDLLRDKLTRGSQEHGSPSYKLWDIDKELRDEYIDIIGWTLVRLWNLRKS